MNKYMLILFGGTFFTAFSQLLLKQSANRKYSHPIYEYLNWRVITAYGIFGGVLLLNTYAFTGVDMGVRKKTIRLKSCGLLLL